METLRQATKAMWDKLILIAAPRSLCEVRADEEDFIWINAWVSRLTIDFIDRCLGIAKYQNILPELHINITRQQAFGLLFLFYAAEHARREASEHTLWPYVTDNLPHKVKERLFIGNQPGNGLCEAFEETCQRFGLRNELQQPSESIHRYYRTVLLQFGLSKSMIVDLPYLLTKHKPLVVLDNLSWGALHSDSFQSTWQVLQDYRHRDIDEPHALEALQQSPWLLPAWVQDVLVAARLRPDLTTIDRRIEERPSAFLSEPRFVWDGNEPSFLLGIKQLDGLDEPRYHITSDSREFATILRQSDRSYQSSPATLRIPLSKPEQEFSLINAKGEVCATQLIQFWPDMEDIVVFDLQAGTRVTDPWSTRLNLAKGYAILAASDLHLHSPASHQWKRYDRLYRQLFLLNPRWTDDVAVYLQEEEYWRPWIKTSNAAADILITKLRESLSQEPDWVSGGEKVRLRVRATPEFDIQAVRMNGKPQWFTDEGAYIVTSPFEVTPQMVSPGLQVVIVARYRPTSQKAICRTPLHIRATGTAQFINNRWEWHPGGEIDIAEAQHGLFRIHTKSSKDSGERAPLLREGSLLYRLPQRAAGFGRLAGYGNRLSALHSLSQASSSLTIAKTVVNRGIIRAIRVGKAGHYIIRLHHDISWNDDYRIIVWPRNSYPYPITSRQVLKRKLDVLEIAKPAHQLGHIALAIAFEGTRLGAWWPKQLGTWKLPSIVTPKKARSLAYWLRWFHLPLLHPLLKAEIGRFINAHLFEVIQAWIMGRSKPVELNFPDDLGWEAVVRELMPLTPTLNPSECQKILEPDRRQQLDLSSHIESLLTVSPLLLAHILQNKLNDNTDAPLKEDIEHALPDCIQDLQQQLSEAQNPAVGTASADEAKAVWERKVIPHALEMLSSGQKESRSTASRDSTGQDILNVFLVFPWYRKDLALRLLLELDKQKGSKL